MSRHQLARPHQSLLARLSALLARLSALLRPPRRLRLRRGGVLLIAGVLCLGLATLNTGNNLLYLLVGALLGLITLSGWLSEHAISGIRLRRQLPYRATAGQPVRVEYRVENRKRRLPSAGLELRDVTVARNGAPLEPQVVQPAWLPFVLAGESASGTEVLLLPRRGLYRFGRLVLATSYPFGLFTKERAVTLPGTLLVWPRCDRPVASGAVAGGELGSRAALPASVAGPGRGEYRGLRAYRPGDDPRDIHWRTTARRAEPFVREYDREHGDTWWLVLDLTSPADDEGEAAVELAASLAVAATGRAQRFGFAAGAATLPPAALGATQLEAVLDLLARVELGAPDLLLPAPARECVLVTARPDRAGVQLAALLRPEPEAAHG